MDLNNAGVSSTLFTLRCNNMEIKNKTKELSVLDHHNKQYFIITLNQGTSSNL